MFFLFRVVFWLAIVFASLPWPEEARPPATAKIAPTAREILGNLFAQASAGAAQACLDAPDACLAAADKLRRAVGEKREDSRVKAPLDGASAGH